MAIYVTGDTHGSQSHGMYSIDGFMHRFNTASFPEQKDMGKEDYVIICGDFGGIWDTDRFRVRESPQKRPGWTGWIRNRLRRSLSPAIMRIMTG